MFVLCNTEARSRNYCFRGKSISITYFERVSVALVIQNSKAHASYYILICRMSDSTIFFHIISQTERFYEKIIIENSMCVLTFSRILTETFLTLKRIHLDIIHVLRSSHKIPVIVVRF